MTLVELNDVAAFSVDAIGAQIGGLLSLWLGVSIMFAFEAFEFFYVYLTKSRKEEPTQTRVVSVAPAVDNPRRSAHRRSRHSLRRSSNRVLSSKLSGSRRSIKVGQQDASGGDKKEPTQTHRVSVAPAVETKSSARCSSDQLTSTASSAEMELSQSVVLQID